MNENVKTINNETEREELLQYFSNKNAKTQRVELRISIRASVFLSNKNEVMLAGAQCTVHSDADIGESTDACGYCAQCAGHSYRRNKPGRTNFVLQLMKYTCNTIHLHYADIEFNADI